jgi:hypothetical protein
MCGPWQRNLAGGPRCAVDTDQMFLTCSAGSSAVGTVQISNTGTTALYYHWQRDDSSARALVAPFSSSTLPMEACILPGQKHAARCEPPRTIGHVHDARGRGHVSPTAFGNSRMPVDRHEGGKDIQMDVVTYITTAIENYYALSSPGRFPYTTFTELEVM